MNNSEFCEMLRHLSKDTWSRIKFSRNRPGLKIFETTITQNLLFEIHRNYPTAPITIYEATDENTNGNDLEIYLRLNSGYIFLPTQAKIVYKNHKYKSMEHGNQINDLLQYARDREGFPLYLLYNYVADFNPLNHLCGFMPDNNDFGCTLVSSQYLFDKFAFQRTDRNGNLKWIIPNFNDLHPNFAKPWSILGCCYTNLDKYAFIREIDTQVSDKTINSIKIYKDSDILENNSWSKLNLDKILEASKTNKEQTLEFTDKYLPKFKIIIDANSKN